MSAVERAGRLWSAPSPNLSAGADELFRSRVAALCDLYRLMEETVGVDGDGRWLRRPPWEAGGAASLLRVRECLRTLLNSPESEQEQSARLVTLCPRLAGGNYTLSADSLVGGSAGQRQSFRRRCAGQN